MIYRILVDHRRHVTVVEPKMVIAVPWGQEGQRRLGGPGYGRLADVMDEHGLRALRTTNPRLRYYFTERGWQSVGRHVAAEARAAWGTSFRSCAGRIPRSQVAYGDALQLASLP
jgi:hypothetical protein